MQPSDKPSSPSPTNPKEKSDNNNKKERLAKALRQNLLRRKAAAKATDEADS